MLLTSNEEIWVYEKSIYAGRNYLHLNLLPSGKLSAGKYKSGMYILYDSGCWYASKIYGRDGSKSFPCPPQKIALLDRESCILYRNEERAEYYSKTSVLPEDTRFYCFVYTGKVIEVVIADSHRCKTVLRATLAPNAGRVRAPYRNIPRKTSAAQGEWLCIQTPRTGRTQGSSDNSDWLYCHPG